MSTLSVSISQGIATISFNRPESLNAITAEGPLVRFNVKNLFWWYYVDYEALSEHLAIIDKNKDVVATVVQGIYYMNGLAI